MVSEVGGVRFGDVRVQRTGLICRCCPGSDGRTGKTAEASAQESESARSEGRARGDERGVAISEMGYRYATIYTGEMFDDSVIVVMPYSTSGSAGACGLLSLCSI